MKHLDNQCCGWYMYLESLVRKQGRYLRHCDVLKLNPFEFSHGDVEGSGHGITLVVTHIFIFVGWRVPWKTAFRIARFLLICYWYVLWVFAVGLRVVLFCVCFTEVEWYLLACYSCCHHHHIACIVLDLMTCSCPINSPEVFWGVIFGFLVVHN
jgi:hypothetical protein